MSGKSNLCDLDQLKVDGPCIIVVNTVNSPTGTWTGRVIEVHPHGHWVGVEAIITGTLDGAPYKDRMYPSSERKPCVNYTVYPDTPTIRELFESKLRVQAQLREAQKDASRSQQEHHELIEHLVKTKTLRVESNAGCRRDPQTLGGAPQEDPWGGIRPRVVYQGVVWFYGGPHNDAGSRHRIYLQDEKFVLDGEFATTSGGSEAGMKA